MSNRQILPEHRKAIHSRTFSEPYSACAVERPMPRKSRTLAFMAVLAGSILGAVVLVFAVSGGGK